MGWGIVFCDYFLGWTTPKFYWSNVASILGVRLLIVVDPSTDQIFMFLWSAVKHLIGEINGGNFQLLDWPFALNDTNLYRLCIIKKLNINWNSVTSFLMFKAIKTKRLIDTIASYNGYRWKMAYWFLVSYSHSLISQI